MTPYLAEMMNSFLGISNLWKLIFFYGPVLLVWFWMAFKTLKFFYRIMFCTLVNENTNPEEIGLKEKDILTRVKLHKRFGGKFLGELSSVFRHALKFIQQQILFLEGCSIN